MFNDISDGDSKNLISLEGRDLKNGCTILLRGAGGDELARVKRVIKSVLLVKLHCKYERSFLLHEDVQTENFPESKKCLFQELTLSPFIKIECDQNCFDEDDECDDDNDGDVDSCDDYDFEVPLTNGTSQPELSASAPSLPKSVRLSSTGFEKFVFTSGMDDSKMRCVHHHFKVCTSMPQLILVPTLC